jgi:predicted metal-dependent hydrolase
MYTTQRKATTPNNVAAHPLLLGKYDIALNEKTVSYTLKRSYKARLIWLNIKQKTGLTVTIPYNYNVQKLPEYLNFNCDWILRNLEKYCSQIEASSAIDTRPANTISYLGKYITVMQERNNSGPTAVRLTQNNLIVSLNSSSQNVSFSELESWYRIQANRLINDKVKKFSQLMGLAYNRVVIRDQKSRWGSCSCRRNLNFNWRLIMAPEAVLDYVIIHELCHLKEMSHSKSFWKLVTHYCPEWHELRGWLDNHCNELNISSIALTPAVN